MILVPITLSEANEFVRQNHRHNKSVAGHKFSIGAAKEDKIIGVCIVGRPIARALDDGWTLEVLRCCTDGTRNANSFLYGAAWRVTKNLGYKKLITYINKSESGVTMKALQWECVAEVKGRHWGCKSRPRVTRHSIQNRFRFEKTL